MDERTSPAPRGDGAGAEEAARTTVGQEPSRPEGTVRAVELVRQVRDEFAARTAALTPAELAAFVAREGAAAEAELAQVRSRAPAA